MITQIYSMHSVNEAISVINAGADYIGLVPPQQLPNGEKAIGEIPKDMCHQIIKAVKGKAKCVIIASNDDEKYYCNLVEEYKPDVIQITGRFLSINASLRIN